MPYFLKVEVYEQPNFPVVTHIFWGTSQEDATAVFKAHMATDSFLRAAVLDGTFRRMPVAVDYRTGHKNG